MRRQPILIGVLLTLVMVNCAIISPVLRPTPTPKVRDFALRELFIDFSAVAPGCWIYKGPRHLTYEENAGAERALFAWFKCGDQSSGGMYAIYWFRDEQSAAGGYRREISRQWFSKAMRVTPYEVPDWMRYQSLVANESRFACADFRGYTMSWEKCVFAAQYEEFVCALAFSVSHGSIADAAPLLEQIIRAIDERMGSYLSDGG